MITDKEEILKIKNFNVNNNSIINSFTRDYNNGSGSNVLGVLLMELRDQYIESL